MSDVPKKIECTIIVRIKGNNALHQLVLYVIIHTRAYIVMSANIPYNFCKQLNSIIYVYTIGTLSFPKRTI